MNQPRIASVVLDLALDKALDYSIPEEMIPVVHQGVRVEVPIRGQLRPGFVVDLKNESSFNSIKPISKVLWNESLISEDLFKLAIWMSKYYCTPLSEVFKIMIPSSIRRVMKPKEQLYIMRAKTRDELRQACIDLRSRYPSQATLIEAMLSVTKGILLSELLEITGCSKASVDALVKKNLLQIDLVRIDRSPLSDEEYIQTKPKKLNEDQQLAFEKIVTSLNSGKFDTHLLFGITGSGKTEIYLQAIDKAILMGKGTIMLVPEISLTSQTIERFKSRFKEKIAILHHRLSEGERNDEWHHIHTGRAKIVVGARSAIFSPVKNLGLIIVDEEHEATYKQNEHSPCYHGRDVAVMRSKLTQSTIILGSATPSLESYYNAKKGKYSLSVLHSRANTAFLPKVFIVDMKKEFEKAKGFTNFSEALLTGIEKRKLSGEQTILFLNRRGYHTMMQCPSCHYTIKCSHCDVSLTYHMEKDCLSCHLCGHQVFPPPNQCPQCRAAKPLKFKGVGTELVEKSLLAILKDIRTLRIDADTTKHKGSHQKLLREFATGKADVLIGTQMIAKGLHFPQVTLVGILNADASLNIPDFRASETAFQLMTQVAGRSGRGYVKGEVIIQTSIPDNSTIVHAANQDFVGFFEDEIEIRKQFNYPPFTRIAKMIFSSKNEKELIDWGSKFRNNLISNLSSDYEIGPLLPCGHAKIKDHFRYQFIIKGNSLTLFNTMFKSTLGEALIPRNIKLRIDIDPTTTFF